MRKEARGVVSGEGRERGREQGSERGRVWQERVREQEGASEQGSKGERKQGIGVFIASGGNGTGAVMLLVQ